MSRMTSSLFAAMSKTSPRVPSFSLNPQARASASEGEPPLKPIATLMSLPALLQRFFEGSAPGQGAYKHHSESDTSSESAELDAQPSCRGRLQKDRCRNLHTTMRSGELQKLAESLGRLVDSGHLQR